MRNLTLRIAWRNIWRNTRRTVITLVTMVICEGIMVWMITFGDGVHEQMIRTTLNTGLGSIQIHALGYQSEKKSDDVILDPGPVTEIARQVPTVEGVSTRITSFGLASHSGNTQPSMIIGVEPVGETTISVLDEKVELGEWLPEEISNPRRLPIVIGIGMAEKLKVTLGDRIYLTMADFTGAPAYAVYFVHGIFKTGMGEMDKSIAYVPIETLQPLMAAGIPRFENAVHEVTLLLEPMTSEAEAVTFLGGQFPTLLPDSEIPGADSGWQLTTVQTEDAVAAGTGEPEDGNSDGGEKEPVDDPDQAAVELDGQQLEILTWRKIQPGLKTFIDLDNFGMYITMVFLFIVVAIGIMNTFLMAVFERIREFGIFMALGTRPSAIFKLVMTESLLVGIIGAVAGLGLGLIGYWINTIYPISYGSYGELGDIMTFDWSMDLYPMLIWANVMKAVFGIIVVTVLAALWPAIVAAMLKPVEALRHV